MFFLDSLMISGIRWTLETVVTAAEAELNDDTALRQQLLEAEMRRELREIDEETFRAIESDLLARIRAIRERREGGAGPLQLQSSPLESAEGERFNVEASLAGDFHESGEAGETITVAPAARRGRRDRVRQAQPRRRAARTRSS